MVGDECDATNQASLPEVLLPGTTRGEKRSSAEKELHFSRECTVVSAQKYSFLHATQWLEGLNPISREAPSRGVRSQGQVPLLVVPPLATYRTSDI